MIFPERPTLAAVGAFTANADGGFAGAGRALAIPSRPSDRTGRRNAVRTRAPTSGCSPAKPSLGRTWKSPPGDDAYLSARLDDPSFGAAIKAALVGIEGTHTLVRPRDKGPKTDLSGPPVPPTGGAGAAREGWRRRRHRL
jgi:uncharacterized protein (DUF736 family)